MDVNGKRVLVIGLGKTGLSTVRFLIGRGASVLATDEKPVADWQENLRALGRGDAEVQICAYDPNVLSRTDMIVPSPGVPPTNPILSAAVDRRIPIYSEIELAGRYLKTPMIAITGTNGKTTTTTLIGEILKTAGMKVFVGGNIGNPLIEYVGGIQDAAYVVVEVSSFQLQWTEQFHPVCAVLMNVTSDHIDYHGDFATYRRIKERVFMNQTAADLAVLNGEETESEDLGRRLAARVCPFSATRLLAHGIYLDGENIVYKGTEGSAAPETYPVSMVKIPGRHNLHNVMAAVAAARFCGCAPGAIIRCIGNFRGIAHRIEYAGQKKGVTYYDDSKGTNVGAVQVAVDSFDRPVILLMGGRDKDIDFSVLVPQLKNKVKELILFGEARDKIYGAIGGAVDTHRAETLKQAVEKAYKHATSGDIVLLSPGCASFDEFKDYKDRGRFFKETVGNLGE